MVWIALLIAGGWALAYAIVDSYNDDDDSSSDSSPEEDLEGTDDADNLAGGPENDLLSGLGGNDILSGDAGHDTLDGGADNDALFGGSGDDEMQGGEGDDYLFGEDGNDAAFGDQGQDYVDGGVGNDTVVGGTDADLLIGGDGQDDLQGEDGDDTLSGGEALSRDLTDDEIDALLVSIQNDDPVELPDDVEFSPTDDGAADTLDGGAGDDELYVGDGDTAIGGSGEDDFYLLDGEGDEVALINDLDLDDDTLIYVYENATTPPVLSLSANDDGTQTLSADEETVAIIAANTALTIDDIVVLQRESGT